MSDDDPRLKRVREFNMPNKTSKYCDLIRLYRKACSKDNLDRHGFLIPLPSFKSALDFKVTQTSYSRACKLLQAIVRLFAKNKWVLESRTNKHNEDVYAVFLAEGEEIKFRLSEKTKRIDHVLTPREIEDKRNGRYYGKRYDYINTGVLTFSLERVGEYPTKTYKWSDKKNKPLEEQLEEITKGFIQAMELTRIGRLKAEEEERISKLRYAEFLKQEHRNKIELKKRKVLIEEADSFNTSRKIRMLVDAVVNANSDADGVGDWAEWAAQIANDIDPTKRIEDLLTSHKELDNLAYNKW